MEMVKRVLRYAGKKRNQVSNPCLTANETIQLANEINSLLLEQNAIMEEIAMFVERQEGGEYKPYHMAAAIRGWWKYSRSNNVNT